MKIRRTVLIICLLLITAAFLAGFIKRKKTPPIPVTPDAEMEGFTFHTNFAADADRIPTADELQNEAEEILVIKPISRTMSQNMDMLTTAEVKKTIRSETGLQKGDSIRIYEPSLYYVRDPSQNLPGTIPEPGWVTARYYTLPMCQQTEYLVFLISPEYPEEYHKTELAAHTFLFAFPSASAFSAKHGEVYLQQADSAEPSSAEKELQELLARPDSDVYQNRISELQEEIMREIAARRVTWKDVKAFGFITDNEAAKTSLETLIAEISNISSETGD